MKIAKKYIAISDRLTHAKDIPLLLIRLVLAYGFYMPAKMKWSNIEGVTEWFDGMGIPMPTLLLIGAGRISVNGWIRRAHGKSLSVAKDLVSSS